MTENSEGINKIGNNTFYKPQIIVNKNVFIKEGNSEYKEYPQKRKYTISDDETDNTPFILLDKDNHKKRRKMPNDFTIQKYNVKTQIHNSPPKIKKNKHLPLILFLDDKSKKILSNENDINENQNSKNENGQETEPEILFNPQNLENNFPSMFTDRRHISRNNFDPSFFSLTNYNNFTNSHGLKKKKQVAKIGIFNNRIIPKSSEKELKHPTRNKNLTMNMNFPKIGNTLHLQNKDKNTFLEELNKTKEKKNIPKSGKVKRIIKVVKQAKDKSDVNERKTKKLIIEEKDIKNKIKPPEDKLNLSKIKKEEKILKDKSNGQQTNRTNNLFPQLEVRKESPRKKDKKEEIVNKADNKKEERKESFMNIIYLEKNNSSSSDSEDQEEEFVIDRQNEGNLFIIGDKKEIEKNPKIQRKKKPKLSYEERVKRRLRTNKIEKIYDWNFLIIENGNKNTIKKVEDSEEEEDIFEENQLEKNLRLCLNKYTNSEEQGNKNTLTMKLIKKDIKTENKNKDNLEDEEIKENIPKEKIKRTMLKKISLLKPEEQQLNAKRRNSCLDSVKSIPNDNLSHLKDYTFPKLSELIKDSSEEEDVNNGDSANSLSKKISSNNKYTPRNKHENNSSKRISGKVNKTIRKNKTTLSPSKIQNMQISNKGEVIAFKFKPLDQLECSEDKSVEDSEEEKEKEKSNSSRKNKLINNNPNEAYSQGNSRKSSSSSTKNKLKKSKIKNRKLKLLKFKSKASQTMKGSHLVTQLSRISEKSYSIINDLNFKSIELPKRSESAQSLRGNLNLEKIGFLEMKTVNPNNFKPIPNKPKIHFKKTTIVSSGTDEESSVISFFDHRGFSKASKASKSSSKKSRTSSKKSNGNKSNSKTNNSKEYKKKITPKDNPFLNGYTKENKNEKKKVELIEKLEKEISPKLGKINKIALKQTVKLAQGIFEEKVFPLYSKLMDNKVKKYLELGKDEIFNHYKETLLNNQLIENERNEYLLFYTDVTLDKRIKYSPIDINFDLLQNYILDKYIHVDLRNYIDFGQNKNKKFLTKINGLNLRQINGKLLHYFTKQLTDIYNNNLIPESLKKSMISINWKIPQEKNFIHISELEKHDLLFPKEKDEEDTSLDNRRKAINKKHCTSMHIPKNEPYEETPKNSKNKKNSQKEETNPFCASISDQLNLKGMETHSKLANVLFGQFKLKRQSQTVCAGPNASLFDNPEEDDKDELGDSFPRFSIDSQGNLTPVVKNVRKESLGPKTIITNILAQPPVQM
ncbi:MAG: hypothetical protein MJ252_05555 [archaeon]|nr:hypothetical protein [archaeon]